MNAFHALAISTSLVVWVGIFGFAAINAGRDGGILDFRRKGGWDE